MRLLLMVCIALLVSLSGCANRQKVAEEVLLAKKSGKEGITKVYRIPAAQAWDITRAVFLWEKVDEIDEHRLDNYVLASSGMQMVAFGTVIGVWIEPLDTSSTRITAISKFRGDCCPLTHLTPKRFFEKFDKGLKISESGRKLPIVAP